MGLNHDKTPAHVLHLLRRCNTYSGYASSSCKQGFTL